MVEPTMDLAVTGGDNVEEQLLRELPRGYRQCEELA
jgi:hypothetical protein